eukprot:TRINITY_DN981_c0_g2_i3.p1 TRINITY_DN981_c0_g2~~TRINITY_DN981_c0_g2_i3.p1  ORF type:complete len:1099 (+),score=314.58 TRINITY_DN981_c0_g2_i3:53-3349(+)
MESSSVLIPSSPNWYEPRPFDAAASIGGSLLIVFGSRDRVFVYRSTLPQKKKEKPAFHFEHVFCVGGRVSCVRVSSGEEFAHVCVGTENGFVSLWEIRMNGAERHSASFIAAHGAHLRGLEKGIGCKVYDLLFSSNGDGIVSIDSRGVMCVWRPRKRIREGAEGDDGGIMECVDTHNLETAPAVCLEEDSVNGFYIVGFGSGAVIAYSCADLRRSFDIVGLTSNVTSIAIAPDGRWIACTDRGSELILWDMFHSKVETKQKVSHVKTAGGTQPWFRVCFQQLMEKGPLMMFIGGSSNDILVFEFSPGNDKIMHRSAIRSPHNRMIFELVSIMGKPFLLTSGMDRNITLSRYDPRLGKQKSKQSFKMKTVWVCHTLGGSCGCLGSGSVEEHPMLVYSGCSDRVLRVWDTHDLTSNNPLGSSDTIRSIWKGIAAPISCILVVPQMGMYFGCNDGHVGHVNIDKHGSVEMHAHCQKSSVCGICSMGENCVATLGCDGRVMLHWFSHHPVSEKEEEVLVDLNKARDGRKYTAIHSLMWESIVIKSRDPQLPEDLEEGEMDIDDEGGGSSETNGLLVLGCADGSIHMVDLPIPALSSTIDGQITPTPHSAPISAIEMFSENLSLHNSVNVQSSHQHHMALGCKMGNVSVDGFLLNERHRGGVLQLQFSRIDDRKLMSLGEDGIVRVFDWKNRVSILTIDSGSGRPLGKIIASTFSSCFITHIHIATDAQCLLSLNMEKQAKDAKVLLGEFSVEIPSNIGMKTRSSGSTGTGTGRKRTSGRSKQTMLTTLGGRSLLPLSSTGSQSKEDARSGIRWLLRHKVARRHDLSSLESIDVEGEENITAEDVLDPPSDVLLLSSDRADTIRLIRMEQSHHIDTGHLDESAFLYACEGRMKSMISNTPRVTPMMLALSMTGGIDCFFAACTRMLQQAIQDQNVQMECCMLMILGKHASLSSRLGESGLHRESILLAKICGNCLVENEQMQTSLRALEEEMLGKGLSEQACKISLALGDYARAVRILASKPEQENIALMFEIMEKSGCVDGEMASLISRSETFATFSDNVDKIVKMRNDFQGLRVQHILSNANREWKCLHARPCDGYDGSSI